MYDLGEQFHVDLKKTISKGNATRQGKTYRFTVLTERLIRLEYNSNGTFNDLPTQLVINRDFDLPKFEASEDENNLEIQTKYFRLKYAKEEHFKGTRFNTMKSLRIELKETDKIWYYGHPEARNYFGSNVSIDRMNDEKEINRGLFSLDGFVSIDDSNTLRLDSHGTYQEADKESIDIYVFLYNKDFGLCVNDYFRLTGMPSFVPRYVLGNWWCRDLPYTDNNIIEVANKFERHDVPLSVFLLNSDWHIRNTENLKNLNSGFTFNKELIPEPNKLIDTLHNKGIRIGLSVNPSGGIFPHEERFKEVKEFLKVESDTLIAFNPLNPMLMDAYFRFLIHPLEDIGVDFFWNNYQEVDNIKQMWVLNHYHYLDLARNPAKRGMVLARNSMIASHRYPILYSGNLKVSWDNFKSMPFFNLSASNIGVCWWSHDIGGHNGGVEEPELYIRSVQLGTFSPILRFHTDSGKYYKREPWRWDNRTEGIVSRYLRLRHRLTSYLYTEAYKYYKTGVMMFQPLYYYLPKVYDDLLYRNEYFFGSELLVAPIVNKKDLIMNRTIHRFYLPDGMWYDFVTGKKYVGGKKYVSFYKEDDYPVFAKRGSIIPLSNKSNVNNTANPTDIEIHVFPGENNTYKLYEDDGISSLYKEGYYLMTEIDYNYLPNNYTLIIRSVEGKSGIVPDFRNYKIRFRNTKYSADVIAYFDSVQVKTEIYTEDNDFIVEVKNIRTVGQLTINCKGNDIEIDAVRLVNEDIDNILSDLQIDTTIKEKIAAVLFEDIDIKTKRINIRKLKKYKLDKSFIKLFLKLLEYIDQI